MAHVQPQNADGRDHAFQLSNIINTEDSSKRNISLLLAASTAKEAELWVDAIHNAIVLSQFSSKIIQRDQGEYASFDVSVLFLSVAHLSRPFLNQLFIFWLKYF